MALTQIVAAARSLDLGPVVQATAAMVVLAGLDIVGTFAAKEWVLHRQVHMAVIGVGAFVVLWCVFVLALGYAELTPVTFGWIVLLQLAVILLDTLRYGVNLAPGKWVAIGVILLAQGYLILAPNPPSA